jgi:hypothetical protein
MENYTKEQVIEISGWPMIINGLDVAACMLA